MILSDCHMHTSFSTDSKAAPEEMVKGAITKGLTTICFTDHHDEDFPIEGEFMFDTDEYFRILTALKEKYKERIDIRIGVEIGLQKHLGEHYRGYVNQYPFDFVIGSLHVIDHMDPYDPEYFSDKTDDEGYIRAFEEMADNIKAVQDFDVLGHIDYVVRYGREKASHYSYEKFAPYIDTILRGVIAGGKGIELNTSGYKYGLGFCHPHPEIIKRYKELGGEIITVGADGHRPDHIAYDFNKAAEVLKACGFKYYTEFQARNPIFKQVP